MTMLQLSRMYDENAARLHRRLQELRGELKQVSDPELRFALQRRIDALRPLWREARELSHYCRHYYDRRDA